MHPYLTRLGVPDAVQIFFQPFYTVDPVGNLLFDYGDGFERYGLTFHKVPASENICLAGNPNLPTVREVIICTSFMDAIAYLSRKPGRAENLERLLVLSTGNRPVSRQWNWISKYLRGKSFVLIFGNELTDTVAILKLASGIRKMPVEIRLTGDAVAVYFRTRNYSIPLEEFSLSAIEKIIGYRFGIACHRPMHAASWITKLQNQAFNIK